MDDVVLAAVGPDFHIAAELRDIGVDVERELGEVEEGVFLDHRIEIAFRRRLEGVERGNLVAGFKVAVGGIVPGVLAEFVFLAQHVGERLDGRDPGLEAVRDDAREIMVFPAEFRAALGVDVEILAGGHLVALVVEGFRQDAGQAALHLLVELSEQRDAAADHIIVVLEHQLALHREIIGHLRELVALPHFFEQRDGGGKFLTEIMYVAEVIGGRERILRRGLREDLAEPFRRAVIPAGAEVTVGLLEGEARALGLVKVVPVDGIVNSQGFGIFAGVEVAGCQRLADHRLLRGVGIFAAEGVDQAFGVDLVEGDGAHHLVGFDFRAVQVAGRLLAQFREGFFGGVVRAAVIEFAGRFEAVGVLPVLDLARRGQHRQKQQQDCCAVSQVFAHAFHHYDAKIVKKS